jgi:hypothetical protein
MGIAVGPRGSYRRRKKDIGDIGSKYEKYSRKIRM